MGDVKYLSHTGGLDNKDDNKEEVSLVHLVREVDIQPNNTGPSSHSLRFGFLLFKKDHCKGFPYRIPFKKTRD
jgi:hypothetical protein